MTVTIKGHSTLTGGPLAILRLLQAAGILNHHTECSDIELALQILQELEKSNQIIITE